MVTVIMISTHLSPRLQTPLLSPLLLLTNIKITELEPQDKEQMSAEFIHFLPFYLVEMFYDFYSKITIECRISLKKISFVTKTYKGMRFP